MTFLLLIVNVLFFVFLGMTSRNIEDVLSYFRDGTHKIIVATTVAEEGLDIQKCNLVIRYEHVTNEIARTQAKGKLVYILKRKDLM